MDKEAPRQMESPGQECHGKSEQGQDKNRSCHAGNGKWLMVICCVLPLLVVGALVLRGGLKSSLPLLMVLICPLSHLLMMRGMNHRGRD